MLKPKIRRHADVKRMMAHEKYGVLKVSKDSSEALLLPSVVRPAGHPSHSFH